MLRNITIKVKLLLLSIFTVIGFVLLIMFTQNTISSIKKFAEIKLKAQLLESHILELRKHEKDFLLRKDLKYKASLDSKITEIEEEIKVIKEFFIEEKIDTSNLDKFNTIVESYHQNFTHLVETQKIIGLTPKDGLYGNLRDSVHQVQESAKKAKDYELLSKVYELRKEEKDFMLRRDLKYVESFKTKITALLQSFSSTNELSQILKKYEEDFLSLVNKEVILGLKSDLGIQGEMRKTVHETELSIQSLVSEIDSFIDSATARLQQINLLISLLIIIIIVAFSLYIGKNISQLIQTFQEGLLSFFKYLNKEEKIAKLIPIQTKDEIGVMSSVVNDNIQKIQAGLEKDNEAVNEALEIVEKAIKGHLNLKLKKSASNPELKALADALNQMLNGIKYNVDAISAVLKEFSNYKFVNTVNTKNVEGDMLELINNVNFLTKEISDLLKTSLTIGITLDDASNKLINNVEKLNQSSNEAAASLEETAAALEEITSTIVNNSDNVTKMSHFAQELTQSAKNGQALAQNTTTAMDEITEQVSAISEAITVIDQIAFQTNILSLNAAVEAATAGEAGKGFAVVAQEVRNLASRSAEAAREIKTLVENATSKTAQGKTISANMIEGYKGLLENINQSTQMIVEITNASKEQEAGITQINDAVTQLDQQTQQNASIASQTHDIAMQTDTIAKDIVADANKKEFIGKNEASIAKGHTTSKTKDTQRVKKDENISSTNQQVTSKETIWETF